MSTLPNTAWPEDRIYYDPDVEEAAEAVGTYLTADYGLSPRAVALLLVQGDEEMRELRPAAASQTSTRRSPRSYSGISRGPRSSPTRLPYRARRR